MKLTESQKERILRVLNPIQPTSWSFKFDEIVQIVEEEGNTNEVEMAAFQDPSGKMYVFGEKPQRIEPLDKEEMIAFAAKESGKDPHGFNTILITQVANLVNDLVKDRNERLGL
jgi:hypothetical protein